MRGGSTRIEAPIVAHSLGEYQRLTARAYSLRVTVKLIQVKKDNGQIYATRMFDSNVAGNASSYQIASNVISTLLNPTDPNLSTDLPHVSYSRCVPEIRPHLNGACAWFMRDHLGLWSSHTSSWEVVRNRKKKKIDRLLSS